MVLKGRISEVFKSIQGEGVYLGEKQVFVRFSSCNLHCKFCDTHWDSFREYWPEELFERIKLHKHGCHSISFTGGEPLLQKDFLKEILRLTRQAKYKNYLETNGTLADELADIIDYLDFIAMDLKLPSSTGMGNFWTMHRKFLKVASKKEVFLKAVVCQSTKETDLRKALALIKDVKSDAILVLQPDSSQSYIKLREKLERFATICKKEDINSRIIPQMHKIAGVK